MKFKTRKGLRFFECFVLMFCFFPFTLKYGRTLQILALYGGAFFYICLNFSFLLKILRRCNNFTTASLSCKGILFLLSLLLPVFHNSLDTTYVSAFWGSSIRAILLVIAGLIFINKRPLLYKTDIYILIIKSISLYVFFSIILFIPPLRTFWKNIVYMNKIDSKLVNYFGYYTRFGLQGFSGYGHTILCSIGVYLFWILKKGNNDISWKYLLLLVLGNVFYGRTGLIVSMFVTCYFSFCFLKYRIYKYLNLIVVIGLCFLVFVFWYIANFDGNYGSPLFWIMEPFYNFVNGNSLTSSSEHMFKDMYKFDFTSLQLLFGHGRYTNLDGTYYMHTDIGFLRVMYYGGIVYLLLYYLSDILLFFSVLLSKTSFSYISLFALIVICALYEAKGESVYLFFKVFLLISLFVPKKLKNEKTIVHY